MWHPKARRIGFARLELGKARVLFAVADAAKELLIRALQIAQSLLQRLGLHLAQPLHSGLPFHLREFSRKLVVRKRSAGQLEMLALAVQGPIPDKPTRAGKPAELDFLRGSRVKAVAIGCLNGSLHGSSISEQMFYNNAFRARERQM